MFTPTLIKTCFFGIIISFLILFMVNSNNLLHDIIIWFNGMWVGFWIFVWYNNNGNENE